MTFIVLGDFWDGNFDLIITQEKARMSIENALEF